MARSRTMMVGGAVAAVLVLAGGGLLVGNMVASSKARTAVEDFIARNNLQQRLQVADASANVFGNATLRGVTLVVSPETTVKIGTLHVRDLVQAEGRLLAGQVAAEEVSLPLAGAVKDNLIPPDLGRTLTGLGDSEARGAFAMGFAYDPAKATLQARQEGTLRETGGFSWALRLTDVPPAVMDALYNLPQTQQQGGTMAVVMLGMQAMQGAGNLSLAELTASLDNGPLRRRQPAGTPAPAVPPTETGVRELVGAGMPEPQARAAVQAAEAWLKEGGMLRVATHLEAPLRLLQPNPRNPRMPGQPAFTSPQAFLAQTKATVTH